jgi:4-amino-4-deoxy-L-arabinose transferase-like glycosyltransferase
LVSNQQKYFWLLLGLSALLFFPGLGKTPLWIYDEVRNAECAREMYERGDWIVPTFNGGLRTLKPPLHYYFMFGGFKMFTNYSYHQFFCKKIFISKASIHYMPCAAGLFTFSF